MKYDPILQCGIRASLKAMHRMLITALKDASEACDHIDQAEQNMAIGTILALDDLLDKAMSLYKAIMAMHRCKL